MTISGFTFAKNAVKLYYPIKASIMSILPLVDEFVIALGDCDEDDDTLKEIESIRSDKIRIIHTVWDLKKYPKGMEHAHQTDIAKQACSGDWLFYLQADEVVHEKDLPVIRRRCEQLLGDAEVEGLLFDYMHFWGDYDHYHVSHAWYAREIRIIRNRKDIHSWESAQSFRSIPDFDGVSYRQQKNTFKLKVARAYASIYHYGWVRPPKLMQTKRKALATNHKGSELAESLFRHEEERFDYGDLNTLRVLKGTHPAVMNEFIKKFDWGHQLQGNGRQKVSKHLHEKLKNRILTFIEQNFLGGMQIFAFKNYVLLRRASLLLLPVLSSVYS